MGEWWDIFSITAVESLNQVVIHGRRNKSGPPRLYTLQINPDTAQVEQETKWNPCKQPHQFTFNSLATVVLNGKECVAVSCDKCKNIKLYKTETKRAARSTRLSGRPDSICSGPDGSLFVRLDGGQILQLDCNSLNIINRFDTGIKYCDSMCYLPEPHDSLVYWNWDLFSDTVQAVSARDGSVKWKRKYNSYTPQSLFYHPQHDVLLVSVFYTSELLVIDRVDGSLLQTIHLLNIYHIDSMCLCNDQIIMIRRPEKNSLRPILSHYRLNKRSS